MKTKARSGQGTGPPPSRPPSWPAGPSHSAAQRAAYTEAHQSTHTRPSGQDTQEENRSSYNVKPRRGERECRTPQSRGLD